MKTSFEIKLLPEKNRKEALSFVRVHEKFCVTLTEHLMTSVENVYMICRGQIIFGLIYLRKNQTAFHCLPFSKIKSLENQKIISEIFPLLTSFFEGKKLFCVNGEKSGSALVIKSISSGIEKKRPAVLGKYFLMECDGQKQENICSISGYAIRRAKKIDTEKLFPLEYKYQITEVVPEGLEISKASLYENFEGAINNTKIYYIADWSKENPDNGKIHSKASINSISENYEMLGGVFTAEKSRKKGYASILINHLVKKIHDENKKTILFVKQKNLPAIYLYRKIGFENIGEHILAYYF